MVPDYGRIESTSTHAKAGRLRAVSIAQARCRASLHNRVAAGLSVAIAFSWTFSATDEKSLPRDAREILCRAGLRAPIGSPIEYCGARVTREYHNSRTTWMLAQSCWQPSSGGATLFDSAANGQTALPSAPDSRELRRLGRSTDGTTSAQVASPLTYGFIWVSWPLTTSSTSL